MEVCAGAPSRTVLLITVYFPPLAADDQTVRYWDLDQGECIQVLRDERWGQITALNTYDHDQSTFLFVGTGRGVVSMFPLSNRTKVLIHIY